MNNSNKRQIGKNYADAANESTIDNTGFHVHWS